MDPATASLAELARSLGNVTLAKESDRLATTILSMESPAVELMPEGAELDVEVPSLVAQGERPAPDPRTIGVYDNSFFVVLPTSALNPFAVQQSHDAVADLFTVIEAVAREPGKGVLQMVSYSHDDGNTVQHLFKLTAPSGRTATIVLSDAQWRKLLKKQYRHPWLTMLSTLVYRRSARSHYHVRGHLYRAFGDHALAVDERVWLDRWDSQPPRSARHLLYARLRISSEEPRDGKIAELLPCGHYENIRKIQIFAMKSPACSSYSCEQCGCRVLLPEDDRELMLRTERRRTKEHIRVTAEWQVLDDQVLDHSMQNLMPASALRCALAAALGSLRLPALVCPPELSFLHFAETSAVFHALDDTLKDMQTINARNAQELFEMLVDCVKLARFDGPDSALTLSGQLLPGWSEDLKRWLTRTHSDVLDQAEVSWEYGIEEPVTSMAELASMMSNTTIDHDPTGMDDLQALVHHGGVDR
ncbi:hypothetical protein LTR78_007161 [Recurvomyces mirabilis]|uniref:Uncharacterized protein n=1 Tax=Recurvomyces mirabilis TaxID=574656 RepID=A0AAE1BYX9_9PEZI|nr:hypothetical protein LTR78_007161 [Recurvomyces mirabilis]KAK5150867.1 hypothetical protein LTS14_009670 [Recurvomyces mirabilis]